jgi:hypothetical protein
MPGFNRQGPTGLGPMTGGAKGYCRPDGTEFGPNSRKKYYIKGMSEFRGQRMNSGWGIRRRHRLEKQYNPPDINLDNELSELRQETIEIKNTLGSILKKISRSNKE